MAPGTFTVAYMISIPIWKPDEQHPIEFALAALDLFV